MGLYDGFDVKLERVLRARVKQGMSFYGRNMPRMVVSASSLANSGQVKEVLFKLIVK